MHGTIAFGLIFLLQLYAGHALQCYECMAVEYSGDNIDALLALVGQPPGADDDCKNGGDIDENTVAVATCSAEETLCVNVYLDVTVSLFGLMEFGVENWVRGCHIPTDDATDGCTSNFDDLMEEMELSEMSPEGSATACVCDVDLCNGAPTSALVATSALLLSLLASLALRQ